MALMPSESVRTAWKRVDALLRPNRRTFAWLLAGVLMLNGAALAAWLVAPFHRATISAAVIVPQDGKSYAAPENFRSVLYALPSDDLGKPTRSQLTLYEDGRPLGPAHALHVSIREQGNGRYSHWRNAILFSTSDGSDPRTNGRVYSVSSPAQLKRGLLAALLVVNAGFLLLFRGQLSRSLKENPRAWVAGAAVLAAFAVAAAAGLFGPLTLADGRLPADTALAFDTVWHALLGCVLALAPWAAGAGIVLLLARNKHVALAPILLPGYALGLVISPVLAGIALAFPHGRAAAAGLWLACLLPLAFWRPSRAGLAKAGIAALAIVPLAILFGVWMGLLWHGPTETLPGLPSGDQGFYANLIWLLDAHPYPPVNLGYEAGAPIDYFNMLPAALGATLLGLPRFDTYLFTAASGAAAYVLLTAFALHIYIASCATERRDPFTVTVLVLAVLVAVRYPFWVVESLPVIHVPALAISVYWMAQKSRREIAWTAPATALAFAGSALSKVTSGVVLVPLGMIGAFSRFGSLPWRLRAVMAAIAVLFGLYCLYMLAEYLPLYVNYANTGPWSLLYFKSGADLRTLWPFLLRDAGTLALILLAWRIADRVVVPSLLFGLVSVLAFAWIFQINYAVVTLLLGLIAFTHPERLARSRRLAMLALLSGLPAVFLTEPAGISSGIVWTVCLGGAALAAILAVAPAGPYLQTLTARRAALSGLAVCVATGVLAAGAAQGNLIVSSGWQQDRVELTPEARDIWRAVRERTPRDALVFTDQVNDAPDMLGGWNVLAWSGQRQTFLSNYLVTPELLIDQARLRETLAVNEAVLDGRMTPAETVLHGRYGGNYAVVSATRTVPASWKLLYANEAHRLYSIPAGDGE